MSLKRPRKLFELKISQTEHACEVYGLSGRCAMQMDCTHSGGVSSRGELVWRKFTRGLGRGHEFMHEPEREGMLAILGSQNMAHMREEGHGNFG